MEDYFFTCFEIQAYMKSKKILVHILEYRDKCFMMQLKIFKNLNEII